MRSKKWSVSRFMMGDAIYVRVTQKNAQPPRHHTPQAAAAPGRNFFFCFALSNNNVIDSLDTFFNEKCNVTYWI